MGAQTPYPAFNFLEYDAFVPRDTLGNTSSALFVGGGVGLMVAGIKASLGQERTAIASLVKHSRYIGLYGLTAAAYTFTEAVSANLSGTESAWNTALGGAAAGAVMGASQRSVPKVFGLGIAVGGVLGLYKWSGGLQSYGAAAAKNGSGDVVNVQAFQRQGFWDVVHRRPLSQTIDELGDLVKPFK